MRFCQLLKLSHAEFVARRKTIVLSVLAAGIPLILLFLFELVMAGCERILLDYANRPTNGTIYMTLEASEESDIMRYVAENQGELVHKLDLREILQEDDALDEDLTVEDIEDARDTGDAENTEDIGQFDDLPEVRKDITPLELFASYAGVSQVELELVPRVGSLTEDNGEFHLLDLILGNVNGYLPPFVNNMESLAMALEREQVVLVKFPDVYAAYNYLQDLAEHRNYTQAMEVFSNAVPTYRSFRWLDQSYGILQNVILVISAIILIGTFVYLLDQDLHAMVVYRALGASTRDLLVISLGYLLEVSLAIIFYVLVVGIAGALIFSLMNIGYFGGLLENFYHTPATDVILLGWNAKMLWTVVVTIVAAPLSLLLMLDQFSVKRLSQKLKQG